MLTIWRVIAHGLLLKLMSFFKYWLRLLWTLPLLLTEVSAARGELFTLNSKLSILGA